MALRWFRRVVLSTGLLLGLWAFWWEPSSLHNADYTLRIPQWPQPCSGLRIAVLADPHTGSPYNGLDKLNEIVDLTLQAQPDLILLAGDYVVQEVLGGQFIAPEDMTPVLARLEAPMGVYAVLGNHDRRDLPFEFRLDDLEKDIGNPFALTRIELRARG